MNSPWMRNSFLGLSLLVGFGSENVALGNGLFATAYYAPVAETVYGMPTSYVVPTSAYATSYIYPTSAYVYPTSYVYPTTYSAASYALTPTSYLVPSYAYRRSLLFPRRWVARPVYTSAYSYTPTVYTPTVYTPTVYTPTAYTSTAYTPTVYATSYYPTVMDYPVVASSTVCAENVAVAVAPPAPRPALRPESDERAPSSVVESVPSDVRPPYNSPSSATGSNAAAPGSDPVPPVPVPAPSPDAGPQSPPQPQRYELPRETKEFNTTPAAPAAGILPAPGETSFRRQARKPVEGSTSGRLVRISNILEGRVVSSETREAEEGVRIIVSNRPGSFEDRVATTDAYGRYAVRLPDGDWTVRVAMPSGRVYSVSQITITGGQIVDNYGRDIPSLTITR